MNCVKTVPAYTNTFQPVFNPAITINVTGDKTPTPSIGLDTDQYMACAQEAKRIYTNQDALGQYGSSDIHDPGAASYMNLFINGVFQPPSIYAVQKGSLELQSSDVPPVGAPIILLFVFVKAT